ncbi:Eukaryotic/viral aspartic protease [Phytophthora cinnamomi]|uniref:Eukaryotic/viral aspartic protease n=1 Tax=Phytophthora cinnamomi TaxID=4785 RepID=UPI0035598DA0|nr:Eukaryotic/viral aspartic protease [Phytophthora cinnamomi]
MKTGGTRGDDSTAALITPHLDPIAERTVSFDDSMTGSDAKDEEMDEDYDDYLEEKAPAPAVVTPETPEDAVLSAGRSAGTRSLSRNLAVELDDDTRSVTRNLADELDDVDGPGPAYDDLEDFEDAADDSRSPVLTTQVTEQTSGNRPPLNGDTPAANKVLGRLYEEMKKSDWGELFEPTMTRQAVWADLCHELARPVSSITIEQVVKETERFLKALGFRPLEHPSPSTLECWVPAEAGAELWKWKKRLRTAFGVNSFTLDDSRKTRAAREVVDPASVPLPMTPKRAIRENAS